MEKAVSWLKDILRMDTTLSNEKEVADYLEKIFKAVGIECVQIEYAAGRNQLVATLKGSKPGKVLAFTGHMDVVPVGEIAWTHPPFSAEEKDGKIYARGASDMKSGLMAAVAAMIRLKEQNVPLQGDIKLLATVGEETAAIGAKQLVDLGYADDIDALVICEPSSGYIAAAHKGALWLRLKTLGKTAHGSAPQLGINAVEHMFYFMNEFRKEFDFSKDVDDLVGPSTSSVNVIKGGNGTNVIPDECIVEIDIRTIASQNHQQILDKLNKLIDKVTKEIPDFKMEVEVINDLPSVSTPKDDPFVKIVQNSINTIAATDKPIVGASGYTDGSQFIRSKKKFPILITGPGLGELAHQPDEYIVIKDYLDYIAIYEDVAKKFLK